jgi:hypothetical protein
MVSGFPAMANLNELVCGHLTFRADEGFNEPADPLVRLN